MTYTIPNHIALCAAADVNAANGVPDWVHLLPTASGTITSFDGRGPYQIADAVAVINASLANPRGMPIDENHATDLAAPEGRPAPARGWIVELQARDDGIWGRVEWTDEGRALVEGRAYRGISPVLSLNAADKKTVKAILRASLVNQPNLCGLTALHQETTMDLLKKLAALLGLPETATEDEVMAAIKAKIEGDVPALQSALAEIGVAMGIEGGKDVAAICAAAKAFGKDTTVALQAQLAQVTTDLNTLREAGAKQTATAFVDQAIRDGRVGVSPLRDHYISRHMSDPNSVELEIGALPKISGTLLPNQPPAADQAITSLNAEQAEVAAQLGIKAEDFLLALQAEQKGKAQ